ncbi:Uncharacterised protein [Raoultella terrigena]|nr:Uncharacterised protein [Raoultella terrigena]
MTHLSVKFCDAESVDYNIPLCFYNDTKFFNLHTCKHSARTAGHHPDPFTRTFFPTI